MKKKIIQTQCFSPTQNHLEEQINLITLLLFILLFLIYRKNDQKKNHKSTISGWWEALSFSDGAIQTLSSKTLLSMAIWSMVCMQSRGKSHRGLWSYRACITRLICDRLGYLLQNSVTNLPPYLLYKRWRFILRVHICQQIKQCPTDIQSMKVNFGSCTTFLLVIKILIV